MRCKNCGKRLKEKENFCTVCGYYNGEVNNIDFDSEDDDEYDLLEEENNEDELDEVDDSDLDLSKLDFSNPKELNEKFVKAYIGEDYNLIKKGIFNIYAALLNWMYVLYRKMYITGIIGLIITGIILVVFPKIFIIYAIITMILLGFTFNKIYLKFISWKIGRNLERYKGSDNFTMENIMGERGGVKILPAIIIYFIFLVVLILNLFTFHYNKEHNTKFWKENSENKANCLSFTHKAYNEMNSRVSSTQVIEAGCKIIKNTTTNYEIFLKDISKNRNIYYYYQISNGYMEYKKSTENLQGLQQKNNSNNITIEEQKELLEEKSVEDSYLLVYKNAKAEDTLIKEGKNTKEKKHFIFSEDEVKR